VASATSSRLISGLVAATFLATGCGTTGVVRLDNQFDDCDPAQAAGLDGAPIDPHLLATPDLACALSALRAVVAPSPRQSLQGARFSAEMSSRTKDEDRMERFSRECMRWARQAAANAGIRAEARYWEGMCLGNAVRHNAFTAVKSLPKLERTLTEAIEGAPDVDDGGPLRVMGMLYIKAPAWPQGIGDVDRGLELLDEAVDQHPDHPLNHLFLAMGLWEVEEDHDAAAGGFAAAMAHMKAARWAHVAPFWREEAAAFARELGIPFPDSPQPAQPAP
jgi:hypothetical protein